MEQVTIQISGGGPFGFRLYGGDEDPLMVAKLRRRSKAHDAGLQEGDILLSINGMSCQRMSHSVAMGMIDSSSTLLTLLVLRGCLDPSVVNSVYQSLGLPSTPASAIPQARTPVFQAAPQNQSQPMAVFNGNNTQHRPNDSSYQREDRTEREGDATKQITTETTKEKFGGTTVTKVRRQEVTTFDPQSTPSMFQVTNNTQKPGIWQPSGSNQSTVNIAAPAGVNVLQNSDQSFTLTLGFASDQKENISPQQPQQSQPMFKVNKVQNNNQPQPGTWQPSHVPSAPTSMPQPMEVEEPVRTHDPSQAPMWGSHVDGAIDDPPKPLHLQRILIENTGSGPDSPGPESPGYIKKKLFGDSAFYDDPDHKYPTIEEQIKMARRVALSLTAPQNQAARGHRMFVKRAERADKWSTDNPGGPDQSEEVEEAPEYNPNPWNKTHTWQPTGKPVVPAHNLPAGGGIPKPPPLPSNLFSTPTLPVLKYNKNENAMSMEEIERMRLLEEKSTHNTVSPQICFSLADDLKNMKGKGGKMFAKRKERSKKWVQEEGEEGEDQGPDVDFLKKIGAVPMVGGPMPMPKMPQPKKKDSVDGKPVNRLQEMINPPKAKMSPWDAAAQDDGCVDQAFEHLSGYRPHAAHPSGLQDNLQKAAASQPNPAPVALPSVPGKMPEGVKKIQGWGNSAPVLQSPSEPGAQTSARSSFSDGPSKPFSSGPSAPSGFKPIKFQAGGVSQGFSQPSSASSTPWSASPAPSTGSYGGFNNQAPVAGICDL